MKKLTDPRHLKRRKLLQEFFSYSFQPETDVPHSQRFLKAKSFFAKIDPLIEKSAPAFPLEKIAKIDVATLRLAAFELFFEKKEPPKVIIDEAVELAKEFGGEGSPAFVNGVLGTLLKNYYG